MSIDDYEAEELAAHVAKGEAHVKALAMDLIKRSSSREEMFRDFVVMACRFADRPTPHLNSMPPADRKLFAMFAAYGALRLELALMRGQQRSVDATGELIPNRNLLQELFDELESLA